MDSLKQRTGRQAAEFVCDRRVLEKAVFWRTPPSERTDSETPAFRGDVLL